MARCDQCPADRPDVPDDQMAEHRCSAHPQVADEGTLRVGGSTIIRDAAEEPSAQNDPGEDWRS